MIVQVPASSANLGPGFDCFGIAWELYNRIEYTLRENGLTISGCEERFQNRDNLAYTAFQRTLAECGVSEPGLSIRFDRCEIPVSRGLGSSAALIVGGVLAADRLCSLGLTKDEMFSIATAMEGHPDNIAPALFGGLTVSTMVGERALTRPFPVSPALRFTVMVPPFELSTALARSVLPERVSRQDAVFNISRAALLIRALQDGDAELLKLSLEDRLHQPFRLPLIAGYERASAAAEDCGALGLCISGAGSTLLCISNDAAFSDRLCEAVHPLLPGWQIRSVKVDPRGATVLE